MAAGSKRWLKPIAVAAAAAVVVAFLGGTLTDTGAWYQALRKPPWQPPDWLFGPVWTLIFALVALSAATAWRKAPDRASRDWVVGLFALNGFLNVLWSLLFFQLRRPDWALIEVVFLWLSILLLIVVAWRFSRLAGALLFPYLAWVTFAAWLNLAIVRLN
ncbi:MAG: tryptophan-rich sensory protein [Pseudorhodoplanes sp.]|nr:tryptophan-rich sensory protein [Pseudorhodoplanes sp.]